MLFIVWAWRRRIHQVGVAGPYTCPSCAWVGTFFVRQVQRQLRIYWIPVMKWRPGALLTVCRNCGASIQVPKEARDQVLASVQPVGAPDPFGPAQATPPSAATGWPAALPAEPGTTGPWGPQG